MFSVERETRGSHETYVLADAASGSSARILSSYGFNCYSFRVRGRDREWELLQAAADFAHVPSRPSGNGTPILFPFPSRIRDGRFEYGGRTYELPRNERGVNAIHGFVHDRPWRVVAASTAGRAEISGQFQLSRDAPNLLTLWPADFLIEVTYSLLGNRLTTRARVTNPDTRPLPCGFGTHAYFRLPLAEPGNESRCSVQVPASESWELVDLLPTGQRLPATGPLDLRVSQPLAGLKLDNVLGSLQFDNGWCTCRLSDRDSALALLLRFDDFFRYVVVYTPPQRGSISLEPYTCVPDAANLAVRGIDAGWRVLAPRESAEGTIVVEAMSDPA